MAERPNYIDLRSKSHGPFGSDLPSPRSFNSARLHVAGALAPELSPLDAFAAQSRLLAKQLEDCNNAGNRMSRLAPLTIESFHDGSRPGYFRSRSEQPPSSAPKSPLTPVSGEREEIKAQGYRPVSVYPMISGPDDSHDAIPPMPTTRASPREEFRGRRSPSPATHGYFGARREQSPTSLDSRLPGAEPPTNNVRGRSSDEAMGHRAEGIRPRHDASLGVGGYDPRTLAPPRSPFAQRSASPRSMSNDSSDDDYVSAASRTGMSPSRKLSTASSFASISISPGMYSMDRSSSISSEVSLGGTRLPRPSFNFSRPISRASMVDHPSGQPSRQASGDSHASSAHVNEAAHTPVSMQSNGFPDNSSDPAVAAPAPSYVYSKFSLPRGKMLQRNSVIFQDGHFQGQFSWETPPVRNIQTIHGDGPPSPPSGYATGLDRSNPSYSRPSLDPGRPSYESTRPSLDPGRPSYSRAPSTERPSSPSEASSATVTGKSERSHAFSIDCSAEEHVSKAVEYHEAGALNKSTYHLRLAARQNHPTGMLLYALACRHGWGMRPNPREGVAWLRKAADAVMAEVADDEDLMKEGKAVNPLELKARKAQFALSIYELGVSHMNGWGIDQDKKLALRCFEIAGSWGDADALAEAGFCYAQGVGCKKDLKKSARFYRQAEAKGISMIGNSWIYKSKYNDDPEYGSSKSKTSSDTQHTHHHHHHHQHSKDEKKAESTRTRTFFGRAKTST